jgi:hypothetical protein
VDGFRLTAVDVRGRRIGRVRIERTRAPTDEDGDGGGDAGSESERRGGVSHAGS